MVTNALFVDLDGTVWNSYPWYALLLARLCGVGAATVERRLVEDGNIVGLLAEYGVSRAAFAQKARELGSSLRLYPSVRETLIALAASDHRIAAVTNLPAWIVDPMLAATGLRASFDAVQTVAGKPRPGRIIELGRELGIHLSGEVYLVGDTERDRGAARSSGISFAWAAYGYGRAPVEADAVIERFAELLRL